MLSAHSKVTAMDAATGAMKWERSAIGHIGDIFTIKRGDHINAALVIDSTDMKKTRIAEFV